jgi:hypothetical protein
LKATRTSASDPRADARESPTHAVTHANLEGF